MRSNRIWVLGFCLTAGGCALNPLSHTEITKSFAERAVEVNDAYSAELNAQILKNILRARDRQARTYTSLSDLKLTPTANDSNKISASGLGLGNNVGDPWINIGGERVVNHSSNLELTISAQGRGEDGQSVYHNPIAVDQFMYYFRSDWAKDLVSALLVEDLSLAIKADKSLLDALAKHGSNFRVLARKGDLTYCFEDKDCRLKNQDRTKDAKDQPDYYIGRGSQNTKATYFNPASDSQQGSAVNQDYTLSELEQQGGFTMTCRQDGIGVKFDPENNGQTYNHNFFRCSNQPMSPVVCAERDKTGNCTLSKQLPLSMFYVTRYVEGSDKNGVYRINPSSIDNMIYNVGRSLRQDDGKQAPCPAQGAEFCSDEKVAFSSRDKDTRNNQVPLFSVSTSDSLSKQLERDCGSSFQAQVKHHGQTYYAGPPQKFHANHNARCYFYDRSGTTLTLLSEIIKLNQVNTELVSSTVFFRN